MSTTISAVNRSGPDVMPPLVRPYAAATQIPVGAIHVKTYRDYSNLIKKWASGKLDDTVIVIGSAGIGKSEMALAALKGKGHCYLKGQATRFGVYLSLFEHINEPVILDDIDVLLGDKKVSGLLKMLLETRSPRSLQWTTGQTMDPNQGIPANFSTKSRTMILANELTQVSKNFSAVLDRSTVIWFAPSPAEIHRYAGTWFKDKEIYNYVGERIHATPSPSCRYYYHGMKWKAAGLGWKKMIHDLMIPSASKALLIKELDTRYPTAKERVEAWKRETGETEQAYYATKKAVNLKAGTVSKRGAAISEGMKRRHAERRAAQAEAPAMATAAGL